MIYLIFIFIIFSYIIPLLCYIFIPIAFITILHYFISNKRSLKNKYIIIICIFLMFIRIVGLLYGLYISKYYTPPVRNVYDVYKELGILCFAAAADIDTFECILCSRRDKMNELINSIPGDNAIISTISRNSHTSGTIDQYYDIYSADDVKWIKKDQYLFIYSIGPDQEDNFADIRYSPTNGTCSRGDLIYLIDIGNEDNRDSISPVNSIKSP